MPLNLFFKISSTSSFAWLNTDLYSNEKKRNLRTCIQCVYKNIIQFNRIVFEVKNNSQKIVFNTLHVWQFLKAMKCVIWSALMYRYASMLVKAATCDEIQRTTLGIGGPSRDFHIYSFIISCKIINTSYYMNVCMYYTSMYNYY